MEPNGVSLISVYGPNHITSTQSRLLSNNQRDARRRTRLGLPALLHGATRRLET